MSKNKKIALALAVLALLFIVALAFAIHEANEREPFETVSVDMEAQVETDGSLRVSDRRVLQIAEDAQVLHWQILKTLDISSLEISSVRVVYKTEATGDEPQQKQLDRRYVNASWRDGIDTCEFSTASFAYDHATCDFYLFIPQSEELTGEVFVEVTYTIDDAFYVYDDVAELYWDYLPLSDQENIFASAKQQLKELLGRDTAECEVHAQLLLPGDTFEDVSIWGHGPAGEISRLDVCGFKVTSATNGMVSSRLHVLFPQKWASNVASRDAINAGGARAGYATAEETVWTDSDSVKRGNGYLASAIVVAALALLALADVTIYALRSRKYKDALVDDADLETQLAFDKSSRHVQSFYLLQTAILLVFALVCWMAIASPAGAIASLILAATLLVLGNYTPYIHMSTHDRIVKRF